MLDLQADSVLDTPDHGGVAWSRADFQGVHGGLGQGSRPLIRKILLDGGNENSAVSDDSFFVLKRNDGDLGENRVTLQADWQAKVLHSRPCRQMVRIWRGIRALNDTNSGPMARCQLHPDVENLPVCWQ